MTGFAGFIQSMRGGPEDRPGALARAMHAPEPRDPEPRDPDEIAAGLMARGYRAGQASDLARRYGDTLAELAGVQEANEAARKRQERMARDQAAGRITAFDIMRMDASEPDAGREQQLERRAEGLRRQMADASAMISPPQARQPDPLEASSRNAQRLLAEVTRARMTGAADGTPRRERRPFDGAGNDAVRSESCTWCTEFGVTDEQSFLVHSDPEHPLPVTAPGTVPRAEQVRQVRAEQAAQAERHQYGSRTVTR